MFVCLLVDNEGNEFKSSEHYFHFHKVLDANERLKIQSAKSPMEAKILGRKCKVRFNWDGIKENVMEKGLRLKFENKYLKRKLLKTYPFELIEGNYWGDAYWGKVNGKGQNKLGLLLMKIRNELIEGHTLRKDDHETEICKRIRKEFGLEYNETDLDCDKCAGQNACITAFIGRV